MEYLILHFSVKANVLLPAFHLGVQILEVLPTLISASSSLSGLNFQKIASGDRIMTSHPLYTARRKFDLKNRFTLDSSLILSGMCKAANSYCSSDVLKKFNEETRISS